MLSVIPSWFNINIKSGRAGNFLLVALFLMVSLEGWSQTPTAFTVTGSGSYCQGSAGLLVGLSGSEIGVTYTLYIGGSTVVSTEAGTAGPISFGEQLSGSYSVFGTNTDGSVQMDGTAEITENAVPTATIVGLITQPTCSESTGSVVLSGLPAGAWTINPGSHAGSGTSTTLTGLISSTYNFIVTEGGCTSPASTDVLIDVPPTPPTAPVVGLITQPTCSDPTGSVVLSGLPEGAWTINPGSHTGSGTSTTLTGLTSSTYNFTVTEGGCTSPASTDVLIDVPPTPPTAPAVGLITQPTCSESTGSVVLSGLPAGAWTINPGSHTGSGTSTTLTGLTSSTYNFTVTAGGCTSPASIDVPIDVPPAPPTAPVVGLITQPTCSESTGSVVLSGLPATGTWTINPGSHTGSGTSTTLTGLTSSTYNFIVTAGGCISPASNDVLIDVPPTTPSAPVVGLITQPTCSESTGIVVLSGLPAGDWTINPGSHAGSGTSTTLTGLTSSTYNFIVTAGGCTSPASIDVLIDVPPTPPTAPVVGLITQPTCSDPTGSVVLSGLPAGAWTINPGSHTGSGTSTTLTGLTSSTYNFTVTAGGCTSPASIDVPIDVPPTPPTAPIVGLITQPTCSEPTGSVVLSGLPAGAWTINPGSHTGSGTSTTLTGLTSSTYNFIVTAGGCTSPASIDVLIDDQPLTPSTPEVTVTDNCGSSVLSTTASGTLHWSTGESTSSITVTTADTYTVTSTISGCTSPSGSGTAAPKTIPSAPTISADGPTSFCTGGSVILTSSPGTSYDWSNGSITQSITVSTSGNYNVRITVSGCQSPFSTFTNVVVAVQNTYYADNDGDGYGAGVPILACDQPAGTSTNNTDCDDTRSFVHMGATEICNGIDDDCDGSIDEGVKNTYYSDNDGDGYGTGAPIMSCSQPLNTSTNNTDCDDTRSSVHPGAVEICGNGLDDNCNGQTDECLNLTIATDGDGGGLVTDVSSGISCGSGCSYMFAPGTIITLTATPDAASHFSGWTTGPCTGTGTCSFVLNSNYSTIANFNKNNYTLSISKGGSGSGTVTSDIGSINCGLTCSDSYAVSATVTLTATPLAGSAFSGWSGSASSCGTSATCAVLITGNSTAVANFNCLVPDQPGTISGNSPVCLGTSQTYSISTVPNATSYTWTMPSGWTGSSTTNSITAIAGSSGTISVIANNACGSGISQTLNIIVITPPSAPTIGPITQPTCGVATGTVVLTGLPSGNWTINPGSHAGSGTSTSISVLSPGTYNFTVTTEEGCISPASAVVIDAVPDCYPIAVADAITVTEDTPLNGNASSNDTPSEDGGNTWTLAGVNGGAGHGIVSMNPDGTYSYIPSPNFYGLDVFNYKVCDLDNDCSQTNVTITVTPVNDIPVITEGAGPIFAFCDEDNIPNTFNLTLHATDIEGQTLTWSIISPVSHGTVEANGNGTSKIINYSPTADFNGSDSFVVMVSDGFGGTDNITVNIIIDAINDVPSFASGSDQTILEDAGAQIVNGWATSISDGDPEVSQDLNFMVWNNNNGLFAIQPSVSPTGTLTYTPALNQFGNAIVTILLYDSGGNSKGGLNHTVNQTFTITVSPVNDAPSFSIGPNQTVPEDAGEQTINGWTYPSPGPPNELSQTFTFIVSNTNNTLFSVQPAISPTGTLTYTPSADSHGNAIVSLYLMDSGGVDNGGTNQSILHTFTITITSVNDAPVLTAIGNMVVDEQTALSFSAIASDSDVPADILTFSLVGAPTGASINPLTGMFNWTPDETQGPGIYTFSVIVMDNGTPSLADTEEITITVYVNQPVASFTAIPNPAACNQVISFNAAASSHGRPDRSIVDYSWDFGDGHTGTGITTSHAFDHFGSFNVVLTVTDNNVPARTATFSLNIPASQGNVPPVANTGGPYFVDQLSGITLVGSGSTDANLACGDRIVVFNWLIAGTIILSGETPSLTQGQIQLLGLGDHTVSLTVTDTFGAQGTSLEILHILDQTPPAAPFVPDLQTTSDSGISNTDNITNRNTPTFDITGVEPGSTVTVYGNGLVLGTLVISSGQSTGEFTPASPMSDGTYTIRATQTDASGNTSPLSVAMTPVLVIDRSIPVISLLGSNPVILNSGTSYIEPGASVTEGLTAIINGAVNTSVLGAYILTYDAVDLAGNSALQITRTVHVINNAPVITEGAGPVLVTSDEDNFPDPFTLTLHASDIEGQTLTWSIIAPASHGVAVANGNGESKIINYSPAADFNGSDSFVVRISDGFGGTDNITVIITIDAVNDVPVFTKGSDQNLLEDAGAILIAGWATAISPGPANEAGQNLAFTVVNSNNSLFAVQPAISSSGVLTYTPEMNAFGNAVVSVYLKDNGGINNGGVDQTLTQTFNITIVAVNDSPVFIKGSDLTVLEDAGAQTVNGWANPSPGPANEFGQVLTFTVSNNNNVLFAIQPSISPTGVLTFTPSANSNGSAIVSVYLRDSGGTSNGGIDQSSTQTFNIIVTPVNDAPAFIKGSDQAILEDADAQTINSWATVISTGPANESGQTLSFTVSNSNNALFSVQPSISSSGTLTFTTATNANGSTIVSVYLKDNGGLTNGGVDQSNTQTFNINITAVNDAPIFTKGSDQTVSEDAGAQTVSGWATAISPGPADETGQSLAFTVANNNNGLFSVHPSVSPSGILTYTPAPNGNGSAVVSVYLNDSGGTDNGGTNQSTTQTFNINVIPVNDAPVLSFIGNKSVCQTTLLIFVASSSDIDVPGNILTYSLINPPSGAAIGSSSGVFTWTPDVTQSGTFLFSVRVKDNGSPSLSDEEEITVTVNPLPAVSPISGGALTVNVGESTPAFSDATTGGTWSIVPGTGTASITAGGIVTGLTAGTVTVTYTITNTCGVVSATRVLTVNVVSSISFETGWNWFSANTNQSDMTLGTVLSTITTNGDYIKNQVSSSTYYTGFGWFGTLTVIDPTKLYKIKVQNPVSILLSGSPINCSTTSIGLSTGWNWIGYLPQSVLSLNEALSSLTLANLDYIKNQTKSATYYSGFGWFGSLTELSPDEGYMIKLAAPGTLIYPDVHAKKNLAIDSESVESFFNPASYEYNGSVTASVYINGVLAGSEKDRIFVYVNNEIRGVTFSHYFDPSGTYLFPVMVHSNINEGEVITFKYYDAMNDKLLSCKESIIFSKDMVVADAFKPLALNVIKDVRKNVRQEIPNELLLKTYPNPFDQLLNIEYTITEQAHVRLTVYDINGREIKTLVDMEQNSDHYSVQWDSSVQSAGMYIIILQTHDRQIIRRVVLTRKNT